MLKDKRFLLFCIAYVIVIIVGAYLQDYFQIGIGAPGY